MGVGVVKDCSIQTELSILGTVFQESQNDSQMLKSFQVVVGEWWVVVGLGGVGKGLDGSSVQSEQGIYDGIDKRTT